MAALFAKDKGFTKVAVIYAKDDDYSNGLKDAFIENREANGIEVAYTVSALTTDTGVLRRRHRPWPAVQSFVLSIAARHPFRRWLNEPAMRATGAIMGGDGWMVPTPPVFAAQFEDCYFANHYSSGYSPGCPGFMQKCPGK